MKAPYGSLILSIFCVLVFALCWFVISTVTTPARAVGAGVALAACTGVFIWFTGTNRFAIARGVIATGASAVAAPLAAAQAVSNDFIILMLDDSDTAHQRIIEFDRMMQMVWTMVLIGTAVGIVLMIAGGVMHRQPRS